MQCKGCKHWCWTRDSIRFQKYLITSLLIKMVLFGHTLITLGFKTAEDKYKYNGKTSFVAGMIVIGNKKNFILTVLWDWMHGIGGRCSLTCKCQCFHSSEWQWWISIVYWQVHQTFNRQVLAPANRVPHRWDSVLCFEAKLQFNGGWWSYWTLKSNMKNSNS